MKPPRPSPARSSALSRAPFATMLAATALALSGCQVMSPIQTSEPYQPADGVAVYLGDVQVRDLVVIANAKGGVGTLSGMVLNKGSKPVQITFAAGSGASASTEVPPGQPIQLSGADGTPPVTLPSVSVAPGGVIRIIVNTPAGGSPEVSVPVMLPSGQYATITPAPSQATGQSPSATP